MLAASPSACGQIPLYWPLFLFSSPNPLGHRLLPQMETGKPGMLPEVRLRPPRRPRPLPRMRANLFRFLPRLVHCRSNEQDDVKGTSGHRC